MFRLALLPPLLALAACGSGPATSISLNATSDEGGNASIATDVNGHVAIKAPGFDGAIKLPQLRIDAADFDVNGVKLYPNSTIEALNVDAEEKAGKDRGEVHIAFRSPAAAGTVQGWFRDKMAARGFKVETDGTGLKGTTDDGEPFRLLLSADGVDKSNGRLEVGSK